MISFRLGSVSRRTRRLYYFAAIAVVVVSIAWLASRAGYRAEFKRDQALLRSMARTHADFVGELSLDSAHLICDCEETIPDCRICATQFLAETLLETVRNNANYGSFGETGELVIGQRDGEMIKFLVAEGGDADAKPVQIGSGLAEPMERALRGETDVMVGKDYDGEPVMAAYHPVEGMNIGIVVKVDIQEQRASFIRGGLIASVAGLLLVIVGALLFIWATGKLTKSIEQSEDKYRTLVNSIGEGIVATSAGKDGAAKFVMANPAADRLFGVETGSLVGRELMDFIDDGQAKLAKDQKENRRAGLSSTYDLTIQAEDGESRNLQVTAKPRYNELGHYDGSFSILADITERKAAELEIQEKTRQYQILLDAFPCIALLLRKGSREIVASNQAAKDAGAIPGASCFGTWAQRQEPCTFCMAPVAWETNEPQNIEVEYGGISWDAHWIPVSDDLYMHFAFDVTESNRTAQQLRQVQKLEAIGTLAGGIAHDFNNVLFAILGNADLAAESIPEDSSASANLREISIAGKRAAELVKQILTFARQTEKRRVAVEVSSIVKEVVKMLRASLPTTIGISLRLDTNNTMITADPTEIHQVVMNLCTNAGQAMMEDGGELEIGLAEIEVDQQVIRQYPDLQLGSHLLLSVSDTGPGMSPEIQERIFEPFFTTKDAGQGTGMGLAVVHGIVKDLDGAINVYSEVGQGTVFRTYLPLTAIEQCSELATNDEIPGGDECVLVVDDEPVLASMIKDMLESLGYSIETFSSSEQALEAFMDTPDQYDVIITDQTMPAMTGAELAGKILKIYPNQAIILSTGFSHAIPEEKAKEIGIAAYISKPINKKSLAVVLRRVLDGDQAAR